MDQCLHSYIQCCQPLLKYSHLTASDSDLVWRTIPIAIAFVRTDFYSYRWVNIKEFKKFKNGQKNMELALGASRGISALKQAVRELTIP